MNLTSPRGWSEARIGRVREGGRLTVHLAHELRGTSPGASDDSLDLGYDLGLRMDWLDQVLAQLETSVFGSRGEHGAAALLRRGAGSSDLELTSAAGHAASTIVLTEDELDEVLFSDALLDAIEQADRRLAPQRAELDSWLSHAKRWDYDFEQRAIRFARADGPEFAAPAAIVGTWGRGAVVPGTLLWSWSNATLEARLAPAVRRIGDDSRRDRGLAILRLADPLLCEEDLAYRLAQVAADRIGARGLIAPLSQGTIRLFIALFGDGEGS